MTSARFEITEADHHLYDEDRANAADMMSLPMVLIIDDDFFSNSIIKSMLEDNRVNNDTAESVKFAL